MNMPQGTSMAYSAKKKLQPLQLGNMFKHRENLAVFRSLPLNAQNMYNIRIGDEGPHGNDQTRCFILKSLTRARAQKLPCVACDTALTIFDEFPLIDGTFFLSPKKYNSDVKVVSDHKEMYLNAICMACLDSTKGGTRLNCLCCSKAWSGDNLIVGTMYSYDVLAAMACCKARLTCTSCGSQVTDAPPMYFSHYSQPSLCPKCGTVDFHFTKPLNKVFSLSRIV